MYNHLSPEKRQRLFQLQSKTPRTMSVEERAEYQALISPQSIESITPPGQQVAEVYEGKDWGERRPHLGMWCVYYSRPGEGKNAKTSFPAQVLDEPVLDARTGRWRLNLAIHWDAVDSVNRTAYQRTAEDRYGSWDYLEDPLWARIEALEARIAQLEAKANGNGRPSPPRPK